MPQRILLVEDDPDQATLFALVLTQRGYDVVTAMTAEDARERLTRDAFALMLTDWDLPGQKGDALIADIKTRYPAMKTILYSNHANVNDACDSCGADSWFRKIEGIVALRNKVGSMLAA